MHVCFCWSCIFGCFMLNVTFVLKNSEKQWCCSWDGLSHGWFCNKFSCPEKKKKKEATSAVVMSCHHPWPEFHPLLSGQPHFIHINDFQLFQRLVIKKVLAKCWTVYTSLLQAKLACFKLSTSLLTDFSFYATSYITWCYISS